MPSPASQNPSVKQQREARRAEKVAALKKQLEVQKRNRRLGIAGGILGGVAVLAVIIVFVVTSATPRQDPADIVIEGLQEFPGLTAVHVETPVNYEADYDMNPPAGGNHAQAWLNCGVYDQPQANENAVHSLEHGAVWITYDPDAVTGADLDALRDATPGTYAVLSPYPGLGSPVVISAWGAQVALDGPTDDRLAQFIDKYWKSAAAPEPGAPCTGAIDGPGRVA
jgi:hypothetical protein